MTSPYRSVSAMGNVTIAELITTAAVKKQDFGGLSHLINHAAAIAEMDWFGYHDLAEKALSAHHRHIRLWRSLPDVVAELGPCFKPATIQGNRFMGKAC